MNDAEAILRRLYAALMKSAASGTSMTEDDAIRESADEPELFAALVDARAYLSRPKVSEGQRSEPVPVMAEPWINFIPPDNGSETWDAWTVSNPAASPLAVKVRIPVPVHLLNPPTVTGEVVEEG